MGSDQTIQTAIFHFELGRGKAVVQWVVAVLLGVVLAMWYTKDQFRGLDKREAQDMAQLARNIARGEGFTTSVIRPLSLWHLKTYRADHQWMFEKHPDIYNAPLYPLVLAGIFKMAGDKPFLAKRDDIIFTPERWLILPFNQICLLLTLGLVFFWTQQLFDRRVAMTTTILLLLSDTLWSFGVSGLPTTFLMLLFMLAIFCLYQADRRLNPPEGGGRVTPDPLSVAWILTSAVLSGLCFLTRYSSFFLLIPLVFYVTRVMSGRKPAFWAILYGVVFMGVIIPWLIRNYAVSHSLLGLARYEFFSNDITLRSLDLDLSAAWSIKSVAREFLIRLRENWSETFRNVGSDVCLFFFAVGLLYGFRRDEASRLRRVVVVGLVALLFGLSLVGKDHDTANPSVSSYNLFVLLLPLVVIYGVAFFYLLLDRIEFRMRLTQAAAIGVFGLANVAPMIFSCLPPGRSFYPYPPYCAPQTRAVGQVFGKTDVGVSDMPWAMAWYADRRCVWLPNTPEQLVEIHDIYSMKSDMPFMFLTPYMLDRRAQSDMTKGEFKPWLMVIHGQLPETFPFRAATPVQPDRDQLLFADTARWSSKPDAMNVNLKKGKGGATNATESAVGSTNASVSATTNAPAPTPAPEVKP